MQHPFLQKTLPIDWPTLTPEHVEPDITLALAEAQVNIDKLANLPLDGLSFQSTFLALEKATEDLNRAWGKVNHLDSVCNSEELRKAHNAVLPKVIAFYAQISLNEKLWEVIKAASKTINPETLSPTQARFVQETLDDFIESGADLSAEKKNQFRELEEELAQTTQKFSENVLDATNAWELVIDDEAKLTGLPQTALEEARQSALAKGYGTEDAPKWRFTLQMPSVIAVMTYLDDEDIRRQVWEAQSQIGRKEPFDNEGLIKKIITLRDEKAQLLGKENFADLILERRMAGSGSEALSFINDLHSRVYDAFRREEKELEAFKADKADNSAEHLEPWEAGYWAEKQRKALYDFDEEEVRAYFPIQSVIDGLFSLSEKLFHVKIKELDTPVWHDEVKGYALLDASGEQLGLFYTDWHPRETKRGGAWMDPLSTGAPRDKSHQEPHVGGIFGNLSPATGNKPALLTHREVETIFHEFGHLLHHLLGESDVKSLSGTAVSWDFVELPSQIMENWCWERDSLDLFARHYETNEPIPEALFQKMLKARTYRSASATMRQLSFGKMDLELHVDYQKEAGTPIDTFVDRILENYRQNYKTPPPNNLPQFTHLFASSTGYAAGYYSYKWAEVLDADAFTRFKNEGVLNPKIGLEFREKILSRGNTEKAAELFRDFMGRDPDLTALLIRCGLAEVN